MRSTSRASKHTASDGGDKGGRTSKESTKHPEDSIKLKPMSVDEAIQQLCK